MSRSSRKPNAPQEHDTHKRKYPLTILGVGNVLCTDDGLGPAVVNRMMTHLEGPGVGILDGGTLGLSLLPILEDSERLILVDAIRMDGAPGTLVRLEGDDVLPAVRMRLSVHQVGVADLLDAARLRDTMPDQIVLLGSIPESIELGFGLSAPVSDSLNDLMAAVSEEVVRFGFQLEIRGIDETAAQFNPCPASSLVPSGA